jgi:organic radical activating enzyme
VKKGQALTAWRMVLQGRRPFLSIEVTRECPLRCPGCYAYAPDHAGGAPLRRFADLTGDDLVEGVLAATPNYRPLHLSLVGGEPLVRYRELAVLLPRLARRWRSNWLRVPSALSRWLGRNRNTCTWWCQ